MTDIPSRKEKDRLGNMRFYTLMDPNNLYRGRGLNYRTLNGVRKAYVANHKEGKVPDRMEVVLFKHRKGKDTIERVTVGYVMYDRYTLNYVFDPYKRCCPHTIGKNGKTMEDRL